MRKLYAEVCPFCGKSPIRAKRKMYPGRPGHPAIIIRKDRCMTCQGTVKL